MSWDVSLIDDRGHYEGDWNFTLGTAWLAGLLEGEGCFRFRHNRNRGGPDVQLNMTDEDVVRRAAEVAGLGTLHGPYAPGGNRQPYWVWKVAAQEEACELMRRVLPFMGQRRATRIRTVLAEFAAQPPPVTGRKPRRRPGVAA